MNHPFTVDEKAGGNTPYAVRLSHATNAIQQGGERQAQSLIVGLHSSPALVDVHSEDDQSLIAILLVGLLQS